MAYPPVPAPPMMISAPHGPSLLFLVICVALFIAAIGLAGKDALKGQTLGLFVLLGGLLAGVLEPMLDSLGLLWFASDNIAIAVTTFHRFIPLYVVLGYSFFFGGLTLIGYRALLAGKRSTWFWKFYAACWIFDLALQATGRAFGLYQYYGNQPFLIFGVPAWWFSIDSVLPALAALVFFHLRQHLHGWRNMIIVPLLPALYAGLNTAAGWPVFSVLNSDVPTLMTWLGGATTIALALFYQGLVARGIRRSQDSAGIEEKNSAEPRAPRETTSI